MNYDWKRAVKNAGSYALSSADELSGFDNIEFKKDGNNWIYKNEDCDETTITEWSDIPINSIHFKGLSSDRADYARLNSRDTTVIEELTKSIMRGDVKITGRYASVNSIGDPPAPGCPEIEATVPVPIKRLGGPIHAHISNTRVTRGANAWYIHTARIEESTGPGNGRARGQNREGARLHVRWLTRFLLFDVALAGGDALPASKHKPVPFVPKCTVATVGSESEGYQIRRLGSS